LTGDLVEFSVSPGQFPKTIDLVGTVVTGPGASAHWEEDWIERLLDLLEETVAEGLPQLGICFGHQALAAALGGNVVDMGEYELGYREVRRVGDSMLLEGVPGSFPVFTSHSDVVTELPSGATEIATNDYGNHGFERANVYTLQSHPEYDLETADRIARGKDLPDSKLNPILAGITPEAYDSAKPVKRIFDNFVTAVKNDTVAGNPPVVD
jgi:GMP synthase (glutamine-hydrolysing)